MKENYQDLLCPVCGCKTESDANLLECRKCHHICSFSEGVKPEQPEESNPPEQPQGQVGVTVPITLHIKSLLTLADHREEDKTVQSALREAAQLIHDLYRPHPQPNAVKLAIKAWRRLNLSADAAWLESGGHDFRGAMRDMSSAITALPESSETRDGSCPVCSGALPTSCICPKSVLDSTRLQALANIIWESRWVSEDADYQKAVGIAAEIRSGNFKAIDAAMRNDGGVV